MSENTIIENFFKILESKGYKGTIITAKQIPNLQKVVKKINDEKLLDPEFYNEYKKYFEFEPKTDFGEVKSLFMVAMPLPQYEIIFNWNNKEVPLRVPPTYLRGRALINEAKTFLTELLKPSGYSVEFARLPQKSLAVRVGLAKYGKNNITYIPGMGSFHRLFTFYSDFPFEQENWQELRIMDLCKECSACVYNCPTGAIPKDRFLLRAERCLTFHNEHPVDVPFPDWIDPSWHNCLVGCLHCQKVCPANEKVVNWIEPGPSFSEEETKLLLNGTTVENLPEKTKRKVEEHGLGYYLSVYPRNLGVLLDREQ